MKTKLLLSLLFFTAVINVSAQDYIPLLNNTSWTLLTDFDGSVDISSYSPLEEVTIDNNVYIKYNLYQSYSNYVLVREDIAARKVFRYIDGQDKLLFDFNLLTGDTITLGNGNLYTVTLRDSVPVMSGRKRIRIKLSHDYDEETWVESVGSILQPLTPNFELPSDPVTGVECSYNNGENIFNSGLYYSGTPTTCPQQTVSTENILQIKTSLAPNPFNSNATITTSLSLNNASLSIINSLGQQVKQLNNLNGTEITLNRDNLTAGLYFIRLEQNGRVIYSNKVLIAD